MVECQAGDLWCHEVLEHLDHFVSGELDAATLQAVRAHVAVCQNCGRFGAAYGRLVEALRSSRVEPLDDVRLERLRARLGQVG